MFNDNQKMLYFTFFVNKFHVLGICYTAGRYNVCSTIRNRHTVKL